MPITISDDLLRETGLSEREALVEVACRLFDAGKLTLWSAARWTGLSRVDFEDQLRQRHIAIYRPGLDDLADDLVTLDRLGT